MLLLLANYISIFPLSIILYLLYNIIRYNRYKNILIVFLLVSFISQFIKTLPYPNKWKHITDRPKTACNCDYISLNGPINNKCGMPSGHVSTMTFFSIYMAYKTNRLEYLLFIPTTIWARYYKKCHNITQIIFGFLLGISAAYISLIKGI